MAALITAIVLAALALFGVGAAVGLINGRPALRAGARQLIVGGAAALIVFGIGDLIGHGAADQRGQPAAVRRPPTGPAEGCGRRPSTALFRLPVFEVSGQRERGFEGSREGVAARRGDAGAGEFQRCYCSGERVD
jgi:ribose/xylose/arabinose/galactoside ABC-type transport system permease subunit